MKKLSIITVNYNSSQFLIDSLNSLLRSYKDDINHLDWEIIIVDNNSKQSLEKLEEYLANYPLKSLLIKNKENRGFSTANNQGVQKVLGEFVLFLNPDTLITYEAIYHVLHYLDHEEAYGIATCKVLLPSGKLDDACHRGFPTPWNAFCYFSGLSNIFPKSTFLNGYHLGYKDLDKIHEIDACTGAFMMVKRECGEEINWFDEDYFWYGDDLDFCFRAKRKGWKIAFLPDKKIIHVKGASSGIKKESQKITTADMETKKEAQKARFKAMRLFYQKNLLKNYSYLTNKSIMFFIKLLETLVSFNI